MTNEKTITINGTIYRVCTKHDDCDFLDPIGTESQSEEQRVQEILARLSQQKEVSTHDIEKRLNRYIDNRVEDLTAPKKYHPAHANSPVANRLNGYMEQRTKYLALKGAEVEEKELQEGKSVEKRIAELPMISEKFMETPEELDIPIPCDLQDEDTFCFDCRIGELEQRVQELEHRVSHLTAQKARHIRRKAGE